MSKAFWVTAFVAAIMANVVWWINLDPIIKLDLVVYIALGVAFIGSLDIWRLNK